MAAFFRLVLDIVTEGVRGGLVRKFGVLDSPALQFSLVDRLFDTAVVDLVDHLFQRFRVGDGDLPRRPGVQVHFAQHQLVGAVVSDLDMRPAIRHLKGTVTGTENPAGE